MNFEKLREFVAVKDAITKCEQTLKELKGTADPLMNQLLDEWAQEGIQNIKLEDGRTIYLRSELYASSYKDPDTGETRTEVTAAKLKEYGLDFLVAETVNARTLSAWVKEQPKDELGKPQLPEGLEDYITAYTKYELRIRKGRE